MNDDIIYAGMSHKDIIYNGISHKAVYLGNKLVWEKDGSGRGIELRFNLYSGDINNISYFYEISPSNYYNDKYKYISFDMFCNMFENDTTTAIIPYSNYYVNRVGGSCKLWDLAYSIGANNIIENLFYGKNVQNITHVFHGAREYKKLPMPHNNIIDMSYAYFYCNNLTGSPVCGNNVINMASAYDHCKNLTGSPVCGPNVINMSNAYDSCYKLTGSPVCGPNVIDMYDAYYSCYNLTGSPVCGPNVVNMYDAYGSCYNLTGSPVCGPNVINMSYAYAYCYNLTGSPVCGDNVTNMMYAYYGCSNLRDSIMYIRGQERRIDVTEAFVNVSNITIYCQSNITLVGNPSANIIYF